MAEAFNFWSGWPRLIEVGLNAVLFYIFIVVLVRMLGKRSTSQFDNFDWIVNIAVGSLAASGILLKNVATLDALAAIIVLSLCQYGTTWIVRHSKFAGKIVRATPTLLTHKGELLRDAMDHARVSEVELNSALRKAGLTDVSEANWVILESHGELTVIPRCERSLDQAPVMADVESQGEFDQRLGKRG